MRNEVEITNKHFFIRLKTRSGYILTEISPRSYALLKNIDVRWQARWSPSANTWYVQAFKYKGKGGSIHLHRVLMGLPSSTSWKETVVNHKDGNGLNNKLSNLEVVSKQLNHILGKPGKNTTGPYWDVSRSKWRAQLNGTSKVVFLGYFDDEQKAIRVTNKARKLLIAKARSGEKILYTTEFARWIRTKVNNSKEKGI